jgi:hypothetical protein
MKQKAREGQINPSAVLVPLQLQGHHLCTKGSSEFEAEDPLELLKPSC